MTEPSERAAGLARLITDYSFRDRRTPELLAEIERQLSAALARNELPLGLTPQDVMTRLGPPLRRLGDETDATFDWHYPRAPPGSKPNETDWALVLRFTSGRLAAIETRIWREGR